MNHRLSFVPKSILLALFVLGCSSARAETDATLEGSAHEVRGEKVPKVVLQTRLYGAAVDESLHSARVTGILMEAAFRYPLLDRLAGNFRGGFQLETGTSQAFYTDDYAPRQVPKLREASLNWTPGDPFLLNIGAVNQDSLDSRLLLSEQTFPAIMEKVEFGSKELRAFFLAEQAVPTSQSMSDTYTGRNGKIPAFFLERVGVGYAPVKSIRVEHSLSHYSFENMSDPVAYQGRFFGNSVNGLGATQSDFVYAYQGFEAKTGASWSAPWGMDLGTSVTWYHNTRAPSELNEAWNMRFEVAVSITPNLKLKPSYKWFRVEADVGPAYYNVKELGHSNREGFTLGAEMEWVRERLAVGGRWTEAKLLRLNPYQADFRYLSIYLKGNYDLL